MNSVELEQKAHDVESLIDDLSADIDDALDSDAGLSAADRDVFGARVADVSAEIDALEAEVNGVDYGQDPEEVVSRLRSLLDGVDYKLVRVERPDLGDLGDAPAPAGAGESGPDFGPDRL